MRPAFSVIIDDRETPKPELADLIGYIHFGDLLRRRQRYLDELLAAAAGADDVLVLRTDDDAERLIRRIETARGETLWLRLPIVAAPMDMAALDPLISKMQYALEPMLLAPVMEDDAPMVLLPRDAIAVVAAASGHERRTEILRLAEEATPVSHGITFLDLRQSEDLRQFLSGATEPRGFNSLQHDAGEFVKSSEDKTKMRAEHDFFAIASAPMKRFLLPTFGYAEDGDVASYRMEHLRIPDAALQFVLGALNPAQFGQLLDQFMAFIAARDAETVGRKAVEDVGTTRILNKMDGRLCDFMQTDEGRTVDAYLTAGGITGGLAALQERAQQLIKPALSGFAGDALAFSHGDPCLSNILFDSRIGMIRLVDPMGASKREDALLHPLYDLAKFSHSVCGGYDFVNNTLFSVEVGADLTLETQFHRGGPPDWAQTAFADRLAKDGWDFNAVRAVEASLFLSMLPLHRDHPGKLLGFTLIAHDIITQLEGTS